MHPLQSEADISTERFRHSSIPTYPPPMLTKTPSEMDVLVNWMGVGMGMELGISGWYETMCLVWSTLKY